MGINPPPFELFPDEAPDSDNLIGFDGVVGSSTMTYSNGGTLETSGNSWTLTAGTTGNHGNIRSFDSALLNDETYWVSWLGSYSLNGNRARTHLLSGGSSVLEVNLDSGNVDIGGEDTGVAITADQTYLFVMELQLDSAGTDSVTYWLSPEVGGASPTNALATNTITGIELGTPDAWDTNITRGGPTLWDEFRLGDTFEDVTPIPEPSVAALVCGAFGLALVLSRRRRCS